MMRLVARITAATLLVALAIAPSAHAADSSSDAIGEEARAHFRAGVSLLQDPEGARFEEAYREFKAAQSLSHSPKILGNVGLCAMKLERDAEAIEAYARYLREVPDIDAEERQQITRDLATLRRGVVHLTFAAPAGALIVDRRVPVRGESVTNVYGPLSEEQIDAGVRPGHHVIVARVNGVDSDPWEIEAAPGSALAHTFAMPAPASDRQAAAPQPVAASTSKSGGALPWIMTGLGVVAIAGGAVTGGVVLARTHNMERSCPDDKCPTGYPLDQERATTRTFMHVTDGLLIGGGVLTVAGVGWLLLRGGGKSERTATTRPAVACGPTGCSASLQGAF